MLAYGVSFGLVAVASVRGSSMIGAMCAFFILMRPFMHPTLFEGTPAQAVPVLITGWINFAFVAAVAMCWRGGNERAFKILRTTTLLMIPFCWIVLHDADLYPREGHVLWVASMVVALFSVRPYEPFDDPAPSLK